MPAEETKSGAMGPWETPIPMSRKAARTENKIRAIVERVLAGKKDRSQLLDLSLGDPTAFGLASCPAVVAEAVADAVRDRSRDGYAGAAGAAAAREAIAAASTPPAAAADVFVASGASGALELALGALVGEGDNILVPAPGFPLYETLAGSMGCAARHYRLDASAGWEPDAASIAALVDGKTRAIIVNSPSNPCGSLHSEASLRAIAEVAAARGLPVVSDEIYKDLVAPSEGAAAGHVPFAQVAEGLCPVLAVDGLAKTFALPGWRVGWVVLHDSVGALARVRTGLERLATLTLGASTLCQAAVPVALSRDPAVAAAVDAHKRAFVRALAANATTVAEALDRAPGLSCAPPRAAMYVLVRLAAPLPVALRDGATFAAKLLDEEGVFVLPGACFAAPNTVRLVTCASPKVTAEAVARLVAFAKRAAVPVVTP